MIEVKGLHKEFDGKKVLQDINIKFKSGECSLIIGASGSGKTVLLKNLVGLYEPDQGEILYGDHNFTTMPLKEKKMFRREMGMLFQESALFDFATVQENVMFPMDFFTDWSFEQKLERVNFCLKRVNLENVNHLYPNQISGGMQKRVGIARAIALNPKYLFCDEPNSGLDPTTSIVIDRLIQEITREYQITTVINTHDMNSVMEIGDHIGFIHQGKLVWEGSNKEIMNSDCQPLNDFVFANNLARQLKKNSL
ncbi:MAG: ATP-binding cassette domain-containing protein [Bacteroidales bacterium]|jgi:phospholipid/cholesterol/gamma-HCH transport system ATP-binding protein|nr:ATP-binding cassette domain-containing protein [Bacteroidales bacterium]MBQ1881971.1 ATP-binding cassette domain-containing protein [Bacteroidales bacterium]MBQ2482542.1 ATP-binding cassette domain-containing protein [Bacteroidales bacterium]MBQ2491950.1 ATP-binding cassette domain-containing protein [Bacteroidales bacterium]MBQ4196883.1 ATP-binding cassette domain-containing protein [Bacteroidales bacterium]